MKQQQGITLLELLIGLGITSSMVAFTVDMANEVENAAAALDQEQFDIKALREKIKAAKALELEHQNESLDMADE